MARLTRHELKQDKLRSAYEEYEQFARDHYRDILGGVAIVAVVLGSVLGLKAYIGRQEEAANAQLGMALQTFHAYVGAAPPGSASLGQASYSTAQEKYKKALTQFLEITRVKGLAALFPRPKAAVLAGTYVGLCEAELGNSAGAIKTLEESSHDSRKDFAALARFALAGELAKTGKSAEAAKIYQDLSDHPTSTVTADMALMGLADAYQESDPQKARAVYQRMEKDFGAEAYLANTLKQKVSDLPK